MKFVFVGAGRLATNLAHALTARGHSAVAVYSRTMESASRLAERVGAPIATSSLDDLPCQADAYILAVSDAALSSVALRLAQGREDQFFFHTSGSQPLSVFEGHAHAGVIYPMQTFSTDRLVDFSQLSVFIEASDEASMSLAWQVASSVNSHVVPLSSDARAHLHLAAVFACNFANHCYALSAKILSRHGIDFSVMLPLIAETAAKAAVMPPRQAQTGPAIRYDHNVIDRHAQMLVDDPLTHDIYLLMSQSINRLSTK